VDSVVRYPKSSVETSWANITLREISELGLPAYGGLDPVKYDDLTPVEKDHIQYAQNYGADPIHQLAAIKAAYFFHAMAGDEDFMDVFSGGNVPHILQALTEILAADINLTF
jgi:hypothetical protein